MTHILAPHHQDPALASSFSPALQIDPNQPPMQPPAPPQQQPQTPGPVRKRKKLDPESGEPPQPAEPRRLRRSHEACARCRSKKIKCDSKHPRCTACASAGVQCHQEDRHKQTLVARGHTERIERHLLQCVQLLKRHVPGFELRDIEEIAAREGIEIDPDASGAVQFQLNGNPDPASRPYPLRTDGPPPPDASQRGYHSYPPPGQPMMPLPPPGYPPLPMPYGPYPPPPHMVGPPPGYNPHMHPPFQHPLPSPAQHPLPSQAQPPIHRPPSAQSVAAGGAEVSNRNDLSNSQALADNFGVNPSIVGGLKLGPAPIELEDLAVGSSGLHSMRDRIIADPPDTSKWVSVNIYRSSTASPTVPTGNNAAPTIPVWLPKDRQMVSRILDVYFTRLNIHRPVFMRGTFERSLNELYQGTTQTHDPGFVCSVYLVLALGTLSELNERINSRHNKGQVVPSGASAYKEVMPHDWPTSEEFFDRALVVKPDLRVTISSLQALILLHWYLYTERQGRTLWRLVGSLVRLSIELGLHHDPNPRPPPPGEEPTPPRFVEEEVQLRIRLWAIVLVHDRGTSILLGRPLAISPSDTNTPRPSRKGNEISEHFVLSAPIAEIQADIINSLYVPTHQTENSILRHAGRIMKSMAEFRRQLPEDYKYFFGGTEDWAQEKRFKLVQDITEDQGLTLLKLGIARILLLRALFSAKELDFRERHRALVDAIVTAHNIIVVHNQLIKFPDIAFFVSPIPLHIAAMVILYGHMSKCDRLLLQVAVEDVWMALDMLPQFRWRWERKDMNGGHPLIAKLAEEVLGVALHQVSPTAAPVLIPESEWETDDLFSPKHASAHPATPTMGPAQYTQAYMGHSPNGSASVKGSPGKGSVTVSSSPGDKKLAEVPPGLFYPFYPETNPNQAASALLNVPQSISNYGYQPSQDSYVLEEKDPAGGIPWAANGHHDPRAMAPYQMPS